MHVRHVPLKRRSTIILHESTSQKTNLNFNYYIVAAFLLAMKRSALMEHQGSLLGW
jgi:hypothetical protein